MDDRELPLTDERIKEIALKAAENCYGGCNVVNFDAIKSAIRQALKEAQECPRRIVTPNKGSEDEQREFIAAGFTWADCPQCGGFWDGGGILKKCHRAGEHCKIARTNNSMSLSKLAENMNTVDKGEG